jgi:hypothetical protein
VFFVVRRATLLIPSGTADDPDWKHLFIVLTDPVGRDREVLLSSISSVVAGRPPDPACLLYAGDHPFIRHDSYVSYRFLRIESEAALLRGLQSGALVAHDPLESALFARVCHGMEISRQVAPKYLAFYVECGSV